MFFDENYNQLTENGFQDNISIQDLHQIGPKKTSIKNVSLFKTLGCLFGALMKTENWTIFDKAVSLCSDDIWPAKRWCWEKILDAGL